MGVGGRMGRGEGGQKGEMGRRIGGGGARAGGGGGGGWVGSVTVRSWCDRAAWLLYLCIQSCSRVDRFSRAERVDLKFRS